MKFTNKLLKKLNEDFILVPNTSLKEISLNEMKKLAIQTVVKDTVTKQIIDRQNLILGYNIKERRPIFLEPGKGNKSDDNDDIINFYTQEKLDMNNYIKCPETYYSFDFAGAKCEWFLANDKNNKFFLAYENNILVSILCGHYIKLPWVDKSKYANYVSTEIGKFYNSKHAMPVSFSAIKNYAAEKDKTLSANDCKIYFNAANENLKEYYLNLGAHLIHDEKLENFTKRRFILGI